MAKMWKSFQHILGKLARWVRLLGGHIANNPMWPHFVALVMIWDPLEVARLGKPNNNTIV